MPNRKTIFRLVAGTLWLGGVAVALVACSDRIQAAPATDQALSSPAIAWSSHDGERYVQRMHEADAIADDAQRCLAYPDLPGQAWLSGAASASCRFLQPNPWTLDRLETELARPDGAQRLDAAYSAIGAGQAGDGDPGDALFEAFGALEVDARSRAFTDAWLAASPRSPHALSAVGHIELGAAFKARGGRWASQTRQTQWQTMRRHLDKAQPLFEAALAVQSGYVPACVGLIRIARLNSDAALMQRALDECDTAGGSAFVVMQARKTAAEARWGGSDRDRQAVNDAIKLKVARNPALGILLSDGEAEHGLALARNKQWDAAYPLLQRASARAPNAEVLAHAGHAANRLGDHATALIYLTQAVRFQPDAVWHRRWLSRTHADLQQWDQALAQLDQARQRVPEALLGTQYRRLGWMAENVGDYAAAKQAYARAVDDPETRRDASIDLCDITVRRERSLPEALRCTRANAEAYPREPMAVFVRAWVLTEHGQPGAEQAAQAFFALPDGLDERQGQLHQQLTALRERMAASR